MDNIEIIKKEATNLLGSDNSGHGMEHVSRVARIAEFIAEKERANKNITIAIALLHDADDYKLFGKESADNLTNTKAILEKTSFSEREKEAIINSIKTIGYSKRLEGISPTILEGKIVSDADMLDAMGVNGILRSFQYNISHGNLFFDKEIYPNIDMDSSEYKKNKNGTSVTHIFEKLLKLKDLMLTEYGKKEAQKRHDFMVEFLKEFFYEEDAKEWLDYLEYYLKN